MQQIETATYSVEDTIENFTYWTNQPFVSKELKQKLKSADIIFTPDNDYLREEEVPLFTYHTDSLYEYLSQQLGQTKVDLCCDEGKYAEIHRHADDIFFAGILLSHLSSIPFSILACYIYDWAKDKDSNMRIEISKESPNGTTKKLKFNGTISDFKEAIPQIENLLED